MNRKDLKELFQLSVVAVALIAGLGFFTVTLISILCRYGNWLLAVGK